MDSFYVWSEDWNGADDPSEIKSFDEGSAAEDFIEKHYSDMEYPQESEVYVKSPDGRVSKWNVFVEMVPSFSAVVAK